VNEVNENKKGRVANEIKGRGLFYGVIAVATFIIMAVGATFAYFTASTTSTNNSINTGSTTLKLKYISYQDAWMKNDLIPAHPNVVEYSFESQNDLTAKIDNNGNVANALCKDDYGNSICSVYVFQIENSANSPQDVGIDIVSVENGFVNLQAMAYEIAVPEDTVDYDGEETNEAGIKNGQYDPVFYNEDDHGTLDEEEQKELGLVKVYRFGDAVDAVIPPLKTGEYSPVYVNRKGAVKKLLKFTDIRENKTVYATEQKLVSLTVVDPSSEPAERTAKIANNIEIPGLSMKTFALVLYIKNLDSDQTDLDANKTFTGQVIVSSGDGSGGVSGTIGVVSGNLSSLQSQQPINPEENEDEVQNGDDPEGTDPEGTDPENTTP